MKIKGGVLTVNDSGDKKLNNNRIAELRKEKGMTLQEVADAIGVGNNTISRYEHGKREPKLSTWEKLAKLFDVSVSYLQGVNVSRVDGQSLPLYPFIKIVDHDEDGKQIVEINFPEDFESEIDEMQKQLPEPVEFGYQIFNDVWENVDDIAFKVPDYLKNAVNWYFLKLLVRAADVDQTGHEPQKKPSQMNDNDS